MQIGWVNDRGYWFYLDSSGKMLTGFQTINGYKYYFADNGSMALGWFRVGFPWYYADSNGVIQTGWQYIKGEWYYFNYTGTMHLGRLIDGGYIFHLDESSGAMQIGWFATLEGKLFFRTEKNVPYGGPKGSMIVGQKARIDGVVFIKGLSLLVVFVICGLLINNWFFKLNTMRLPELKKQAAQYVVQQYENKRNGLKSDFGSAENIDLETATISGPFLGVSKAGPVVMNITLYWTISSHGVLIGTVEQDLGLFAIGSYFGTPKMWIQTSNAGLLQEMNKQKLPCLVWTVAGTNGWPPSYRSDGYLGFYSPADGNFHIEKSDEQVSEIIESHLGEEHLDFMANPERILDLTK